MVYAYGTHLGTAHMRLLGRRLTEAFRLAGWLCLLPGLRWYWDHRELHCGSPAPTPTPPCDLRLSPPQSSGLLFLIHATEGWMGRFLRSPLAVTFWQSMNSKGTRQVRADGHVGSSHLSLPGVSAPHFQQCQTPGPVRVKLPILKLFKDSCPSAWGSFESKAGRLLSPQLTLPLI